MNKIFRGFTAILYKEFIVVLRDPMTLFFMFFPPLIEMIAFGYALDNDVKHMSTVILDEDRTVESRLLVDRLVNTETFRVAGEAQSLISWQPKRCPGIGKRGNKAVDKSRAGSRQSRQGMKERFILQPFAQSRSRH